MSNVVTDEQAWLAATGIARARGVFITATDTGAGKTWVSRRLIVALRANGLEVVARKPVESGWNAADVTTTDAWQLAQAADIDPVQVCRYHFHAPLSPPRAAAQEGVTLSIATLAQACWVGVTDQQYVLVEGAGGFYSPLAADGLNADLAVALGLPVLLVTEDRVGCLNPVLLSLEAAQRRGLQIAGIVLNRRTPPPAGMDNAADLRAFTSVPLWQTA